MSSTACSNTKSALQNTLDPHEHSLRGVNADGENSQD
jgi:hypothetical protein